MIQAVSVDPSGAAAIASIHQTPVPFSTAPELVESLVRALGFHARGFEDVLARAHGHSPFDNLTTSYTGVLPPEVLAAVNALVERVAGDPDATNYIQTYYQPSGNLEIPMLTLHNTLDPVVPFFHEPAYMQVAAAAGNADLLVQRSVSRFGHCEFEVEEMVQALQDLVGWVENGSKPLP